MLRVELEYRGQWRCEGSRGCDMGECRGGGVGKCRDGGVGVQAWGSAGIMVYGGVVV